MKRLLTAIFVITLAQGARAQTPAAGGGEVVDRMVAVVNGSELITYSDLLWQLALQPGVPLDSPRREDLRRALELLIDQRLVIHEAHKLPHVHADEEELKRAEAELANRFPSRQEFQSRLERTGLTAAQLREIIHERIDMVKYLDFRFRSFTVVTPQEVEAYYKDVFVPRRRRQSPGAIVPELKAVYEQVQAELVERKVESETDAFLESSRDAAQITFLDESLADGLLRGGGGQGAGAGRTAPPSNRSSTPPNP
ncbi:MAG: SurA N-terminal domain-containing protein [Acidobacteria bacterium]|nr:SurA N-terminal domain-containing protein [Acidobacteriota bacterium]